MAFPRSARFNETAATEVPGPGSYNPLSPPDGAWKRGAMGEKTGRFRDESGGQSDGFAIYEDTEGKENKGRREVGKERARMQLDEVKHKLTAAHEKELNRLTSKLTKSDLSLESSVAEIRTLKDTIRTLQLSLTKSTTSLAKHTASLPLLQSQLTTLTTSHATSRARKDAELVALKDDHAAQLSTQDATISSLESSLASAESTTAAILSTSQSTISSLTSITSSLSTTHTTSLANLSSSLATAQSQILSLSRQISERTSQVSELVSYSQSLEEELALLSQSHDDLTDELSWRARECKWERETGVRSEKEWRQRARSDGRELVSLRAEVEGWVMGRDIERSVELCEREEGERRIEEVRREVEALEDELEVAEGNELWASEVEIPRLEACVGQLEGELEEALESEERTREELVEMGERKARVEGEKREREGELEEMRRRVSDLEGEWERERSERLRVEKALGYSRIAEMGLREEVDALTSSLDSLSHVSASQSDLHRTIDLLARRAAAAEADVQELGEQNTELVSHGNPLQKIRRVGDLREALAESRKAHLATTSDLAHARSENNNLVAELSAYRCIPSSNSSSAPASRSRILRATFDVPVTEPSTSISLSEVDWEQEGSRVVRKAGRMVYGGDSQGLEEVLEEDEEPSYVEEVEVETEGNKGGMRMEGRMRVEDLW